jgi:UTP--glucose-1-phosphate uridylyltransferase
VTVRKAIIPTAGLGTRLRPWTFGCPKAMLPLVDARGRIRPVLHWVLAEAGAAGIERAALVISPEQADTFDRYLSSARRAGTDDLPARVEMIPQGEPRGFGDAILRARSWVADAPAVAILLGDHVYTHGASGSCLGQLLEAYDAHGGAAMVGMQPVGPERLAEVGVARGGPVDDPDTQPAEQTLYPCEELIEKPSADVARSRFVTPGLEEERFLAHAGLYVFAAEIFEVLAELAADGDSAAELELTDAQAELLRRHPQAYRLLRLDGRAHDTGTPAGYAATFAAFGASGGH